MKQFLAAAALVFSFSIAQADMSEEALKMVPGGTISHVGHSKVDVLTPAGTIVEIDFTLAGAFKDAEGEVIEKDIFVPLNGHKNLADIVADLKARGHVLKGEWSYDKGFRSQSWQYEVETLLNGVEHELTIDGYSGSIIESKVD